VSIEDGYLLPALEKDKLIVTPFPATEGFSTWFTGAGDQISPLVRGGNTTKIKLAWDAVEARGAKSVELQFAEVVELHDGQAWYTPADDWTDDDLLDVQVVIPTNVVTASGAGNCDKVPTGAGYDLLVPSAGTGGFQVDLAAAVPIPVTSGGFWDVDYKTAVITPSATPGKANYQLLMTEKSAHYVKQVPLGHPLGVFDIDAYKATWIHPSWKTRVTVTKNSAGAGRFAGWLLAFRENIE